MSQKVLALAFLPMEKCFVGLAAMQRSSDISQLTETDRFALAEIMAALNVL